MLVPEIFTCKEISLRTHVLSFIFLKIHNCPIYTNTCIVSINYKALTALTIERDYT